MISTRVTVEGINWGVNSHVMLYALSHAPDTPARVPLWALVEVRAPDECESPVGQIAQLGRNAGLLRRYAFDGVRGDFSAFPAALRIVEDHAATIAKPKTIKTGGYHAAQRTGSQAASHSMSVYHLHFGCVARVAELTVVDLVSR